MRAVIATLLDAGLASLTDREMYRLEEHARLVVMFRETWPAMFRHVNSDVRREVVRRLAELQTDRGTKDLQPELGDLLREVGAAEAE